MQDLAIYERMSVKFTQEKQTNLRYSEASGLARNTKVGATSLGCPGRPRGLFACQPSICFAVRVSGWIGV